MNIKYSVSNWIYGEEPIEEQFRRLSRLGYDAIELIIIEPEKFELKLMEDLMEKYSLSCASNETMMNWTPDKSNRRSIIDKDPEVRKKTVEYIKSCLDIANKIGSSVVSIVPSGVSNIFEEWTDENKNVCAEVLQELGDYAKSLGSVFLVIEPINRYENMFLRRCEQALELLNITNHPCVKIHLDFFHTNIEEDNNGDAIRLAGKDLAHCHIADSNRKSVGRGQTDWFEIFRALRDINYEGILACEPIPPTGDVFESMKGTRPEADLYTKECIEYLRFVESVIR